MSTAFLRPSSLLLASAVAAMTFSCSSPDAQSDDNGANEAAATTVDGTPGSMVGGHNMTLFGGADKLYLSHIPLYANPHGKQVIVEVSITSGVPADALAQFNTNNFTVAPKAAMSLYDFAAGNVHAMAGTIYFGNLESGGRPVYANVQFAIKKVVFQKTLSAATPVNANLDYVAMGTPDNAFLVHVIDKAPSYDQVVSVKIPANSFLDSAALDAGTIVTVNGGVNGIRTRLSSGVTITAKGPAAPIPVTDVSSSGTGASSLGEGETTIGRKTAQVENNGMDVSGVPVNPTVNTLTVSKELGCLPGPDFYGSCPAVAVTH